MSCQTDHNQNLLEMTQQKRANGRQESRRMMNLASAKTSKHCRVNRLNVSLKVLSTTVSASAKHRWNQGVAECTMCQSVVCDKSWFVGFERMWNVLHDPWLMKMCTCKVNPCLEWRKHHIMDTSERHDEMMTGRSCSGHHATVCVSDNRRMIPLSAVQHFLGSELTHKFNWMQKISHMMWCWLKSTPFLKCCVFP